MTKEDLCEKTWAAAASACGKDDRKLLLDIGKFLGDQNEVVLAAVFKKLAEVGGRPLQLCAVLLLTAITELVLRSMTDGDLPPQKEDQ